MVLSDTENQARLRGGNSSENPDFGRKQYFAFIQDSTKCFHNPERLDLSLHLATRNVKLEESQGQLPGPAPGRGQCEATAASNGPLVL